MTTNPILTEIVAIAKEIQKQSQHPNPLHLYRLKEADRVVQRLREVKDEWDKLEHQYKKRQYENADRVANFSLMFEELVGDKDTSLNKRIRQNIRGLTE